MEIVVGKKGNRGRQSVVPIKNNNSFSALNGLKILTDSDKKILESVRKFLPEVKNLVEEIHNLWETQLTYAVEEVGFKNEGRDISAKMEALKELLKKVPIVYEKVIEVQPKKNQTQKYSKIKFRKIEENNECC